MKTTAEKQFQNLQKDILCWFNIVVKYCNSRWKTFKYEIISFWFIKVPEKHLYLAVEQLQQAGSCDTVGSNYKIIAYNWRESDNVSKSW